MTVSRSEALEGARGRGPGATRARAGGSMRLPGRPGSVLGGVAAVALAAVLAGYAGAGWLGGGGLGVEVLLVLAGYVVTAVLLDEVDRTGRVELAAFYRRAAGVLAPALAVVLAVVCGGALLVGTEETVGALKAEAGAALVGLANWYSAGPTGVDGGALLGHLWAVALVAQFVVVWPLVLVGCARQGGRQRVHRVARTLAVVSAALMIVLVLMWDVPGSDATARVAFGTDTRLTGLMLGAALATLRVPERAVPPAPPTSRPPWDLIGVSALAGLITVFVLVPEFSTAAFRGGIVVAAVLGGTLLAAVTAPSSRVGAVAAGVPLLAWIGDRAYAMYLWHWPVLVVRDGLPGHGAWGTTLAVAVVVVLADATHRYVERPIRTGAVGRMLDRMRWEDATTAAQVRRRMFAVVAVAGVGVTVIVAGMVTTPSAARPTIASAAASAAESAAVEAVVDEAGEAVPELPPVDCAVARCVALTFDDGPGQHTERLLDILDALDVRATFFMLGTQVEQFPDVARRAHEAGHEIGTHTYDHDDLVALGSAAAEEEIRTGVAAITATVGVTPTLFRPPYGSSDETIRELVGEQGMAEIQWDVDTLDWKYRDAATVTARTLDQATRGSIVLMHDIRPTTVDAVPAIVIGLRMAGYTLVPVGTLLDGVLEPGATFTSQPGVAETPAPTSTPTSTPSS